MGPLDGHLDGGDAQQRRRSRRDRRDEEITVGTGYGSGYEDGHEAGFGSGENAPKRRRRERRVIEDISVDSYAQLGRLASRNSTTAGSAYELPALTPPASTPRPGSTGVRDTGNTSADRGIGERRENTKLRVEPIGKSALPNGESQLSARQSSRPPAPMPDVYAAALSAPAGSGISPTVRPDPKLEVGTTPARRESIFPSTPAKSESSAAVIPPKQESRSELMHETAVHAAEKPVQHEAPPQAASAVIDPQAQAWAQAPPSLEELLPGPVSERPTPKTYKKEVEKRERSWIGMILLTLLVLVALALICGVGYLLLSDGPAESAATSAQTAKETAKKLLIWESALG